MGDKGSLYFGYDFDEYKKFRKNAWYYLVSFSVLYCMLYCCRLNLSNASALIIKDLGWNKEYIGVLTGVLFWTYGIGQAVNGRLSEIFGTTRFVVLSVVLSVLANILFAFQNSFALMILLWGLNGYFQSMAWTPGLASLTKWWPARTRGFATGFAHAFSGFGQAAATLSVSFAIFMFPSLGWKSAFIVAPAFPIVALVFYLVMARSSPASIGLRPYEESEIAISREEKNMEHIAVHRSKLYPYKYLAGSWRFRLWLFVAFATGFARYGLVTWIPLYFIEEFSINITEGLLASLALPVGMGAGTLLVPWISDYFYLNNRLRVCLHCALLGAASVCLVMFLDPRIPAHMLITQILLFVSGFCIYAINGTAWAFATDLGGRIFSATAAGCLNFSAYMGAAVQSFVYGFMLDHFGWKMIFMTIAILCLCIAACSIISSQFKSNQMEKPA